MVFIDAVAKTLWSKIMEARIKFCHISPAAHILHAAAHSSCHMALQHLVGDNLYTKRFKQLSHEGEYIYLDNSQFELGRPCSIDELIKAGHIINASCLILPDGDMSEEDCKIIHANGFEVMVIPEGPALDELFIDALSRPYIDKVGLSYSKTSQYLGHHRHSATSRFDFLTGLGTILPIKKIHMLGAVVPGEIGLMRPFRDAIFSWDTSLAIWAGLNDEKIENFTHKNSNEVNFNSDLQWNQTCDSNIAYINKLLDL